MALTRVVYNDAEERRLQQGPIGDHFEDEGRDVARAARGRVRVLSGKLLGSIDTEPAEVTGDDVAVDVRADAENAGFPYAIAHEFSTRHMVGTPFLIPSLEEIDG